MALRVVDLGDQGGLRSQTVWHAIADVMGPDDDPVLALQRPTEGYVSIGFHRALAEIDLKACRRRDAAVYRRRVGGGPVYCDEAQLFFQLIVPVAKAPKVVDRAWRRYLAPAVEAFRRMGADARLSGANDIVVGDRKVSGLGAATIGDAMVFVGNVIFDFDYQAMTDVLALPDERFSNEVLRLMRRYLAPIDAVTGARCLVEGARGHLIDAYAEALGDPVFSALREAEEQAASRFDRLFCSSEWLSADRPQRPVAIKIRSGIGVVDVQGAMVSFVDGTIDQVALTEGWVAAPSMRAQLEHALSGLQLDEGAITQATGRPDLAAAIVHAHHARF